MPTLIGYLNHHVHHFTAHHPLYRSLIDNPPEGYRIVEGEEDRDSYPCWIPTCPTETKRKSFVFIEDWHTLFAAGNGQSRDFDIQGPLVQEKKSWLAQDNVLGIITHMRATVADCVSLFGKELAHKIHYVPLAFPPVKFTRPKSDKVRFLWTSSHGGAGQESCWRLRGGPETEKAFRLLGKPEKASLTIVGGPGDTRHLAENDMHELYSNHDVFVVPSVRIHSVSVARALMYGMPVIVSDGWGYKEFLPVGSGAGFICHGQWGLTCWHDKVFREDYSKMPVLFNPELANNVCGAMEVLLDRDRLEAMSHCADMMGMVSFNISERNRILKGILDKELS
ncbi:MAG: glycosyltransferase [Candidatus Omnitrophica bacterium]|nr:glycosyltransferase [Candidatus Omnitrophota bacterium]MDE2215378.1 glycosyltransferase [Candidatus Omnitrophota bacterium]